MGPNTAACPAYKLNSFRAIYRIDRRNHVPGGNEVPRDGTGVSPIRQRSDGKLSGIQIDQFCAIGLRQPDSKTSDKYKRRALAKKTAPRDDDFSAPCLLVQFGFHSSQRIELINLATVILQSKNRTRERNAART